MSRVFDFMCRTLVLLALTIPGISASCGSSTSPLTIEIVFQSDGGHVSAAATELRRYLYLITSEVPKLKPMSDKPNQRLSTTNETLSIVLIDSSTRNRDMHEMLMNVDATWAETALPHQVGDDDHILHYLRTSNLDPKCMVCHGASSLATKYAVFSLLEELGVGFRLHGRDAVPHFSTQIVANKLEQRLNGGVMTPGAVNIRGIQPFHDFSEGPDQWNEDDYKMHFEQLVKLKMNFIGLHTYPNREPTVWTGLPNQFDEATGMINESYAISYMTTGGGGDWGGTPFPSTDNYTFGSRQLMAGGEATPLCYGSDLLDGHGSCLPPQNRSNMTNNNELFNTVGTMLAHAFNFAKTVGVKTCIGTEAPLAIPSNSASKATATELYEGIFKRIHALNMSLDYYWIWSGEGWGARSRPVPMSDPLVQDIFKDFLAADTAKHAVGSSVANFSLATCGWTLGPKANRSYFDALPQGWTLSSINEAVGNTPTEPEYANVKDHAKWAIPWLEDDPGLLAPQLWLNRTLEYSAQAVSYGATGLLGIHWRVKEVSPQLGALAQFPWNPTLTSLQSWQTFFAAELGGASAVSLAAANILASVDSFNLPRPDTWSGGPGELIPVCADMSTYAFVDKFLALREEISDLDALARFDFWAHSLSYMRAMAIVGCDWKGLNTCLNALPPGSTCIPDTPTTNDCYHDCGGPTGRIMPITIAISDNTMTRAKCATECYGQAGKPMYAGVEFGVACFCSMDKPSATYATPCPNKTDATCTMTPNTMCRCSGNKSSSETCGGDCLLEAFTYTCTNPNTTKRHTAALKCVDAAVTLVNSSTLLMNELLATVETTGTIGSVENIMQHSFPVVLSHTLSVLEDAIGAALPVNATPSFDYTGTERIFLTTTRQSAKRGVALSLRVFVLSQSPTNTIAPIIHHRSMGSASVWTNVTTTLKMSDRGVFEGVIAANNMLQDVEYFVSWKSIVWPAAAPKVPHTVVVF